MSKCKLCNNEMSDFNTISCTRKLIGVNGEQYPVALYENSNDIDRCHDCNVLKGQSHHVGCDMERCPNCGEQLISCDCKIEDESKSD